MSYLILGRSVQGIPRRRPFGTLFNTITRLDIKFNYETLPDSNFKASHIKAPSQINLFSSTWHKLSLRCLGTLVWCNSLWLQLKPSANPIAFPFSMLNWPTYSPLTFRTFIHFFLLHFPINQTTEIFDSSLHAEWDHSTPSAIQVQCRTSLAFIGTTWVLICIDSKGHGNICW